MHNYIYQHIPTTHYTYTQQITEGIPKGGQHYITLLLSYLLFLQISSFQGILPQHYYTNMDSKQVPLPKQSPKIALPIFHEKAEVRRNQHAVHFFYNEVLKEYHSRLKARLQLGRKTAFTEQSSLQRFDQAIKYYYNDSMSFYTHSVKKRESTGSGKQEPLSFLSMEHMDWKGVNKFQGLVSEEESQSCLFRIPEFRTSYIPRIVHSSQPNKEREKEEEGTKKEAKQTECTSSISQSESSQDYPNYAGEAQNNTNCLMIGSFMNNRIKRKPKLQRIYLQFDNVFIKLAINGRDSFFERASLELTKSEKKDVAIHTQTNQQKMGKQD